MAIGEVLVLLSLESYHSQMCDYRKNHAVRRVSEKYPRHFRL